VPPSGGDIESIRVFAGMTRLIDGNPLIQERLPSLSFGRAAFLGNSLLIQLLDTGLRRYDGFDGYS